MPKDIQQIRKGQAITAVRLNQFADGINTLNREAVDAPNADENDLGVPADAAAAPDIYNETTRTTTLVQVFDDVGENYAEIDRIESVTFQNSEGDTITLNFTN